MRCSREFFTTDEPLEKAKKTNQALRKLQCQGETVKRKQKVRLCQRRWKPVN